MKHILYNISIFVYKNLFLYPFNWFSYSNLVKMVSWLEFMIKYEPFSEIRAPWIIIAVWSRSEIHGRWFMVAWFIKFVIIFNIPDDTTDFLSLLFSLALSWTAAAAYEACSAACCWLNNWLSDTITEFRMFRFIVSEKNYKRADHGPKIGPKMD